MKSSRPGRQRKSCQWVCTLINSDVESKKQLGLLPNLYQAVLYYVLWGTCEIADDDFWNVLGSGGVQREKVPL